MKNLSTTTTSFSGAMMARQDELNACTTVDQVKQLVLDIINNKDNELYPSAVQYGKGVLAKLQAFRNVTKAWSYIYNIILAGDNEGCFWTEESAARQRA